MKKKPEIITEVTQRARLMASTASIELAMLYGPISDARCAREDMQHRVQVTHISWVMKCSPCWIYVEVAVVCIAKVTRHINNDLFKQLRVTRRSALGQHLERRTSGTLHSRGNNAEQSRKATIRG